RGGPGRLALASFQIGGARAYPPRKPVLLEGCARSRHEFDDRLRRDLDRGWLRQSLGPEPRQRAVKPSNITAPSFLRMPTRKLYRWPFFLTAVSRTLPWLP